MDNECEVSMDEEFLYCELCWKEISIYQDTVGEGFCSDCKAIMEERDEL